jgi:hypothetical protein
MSSILNKEGKLVRSSGVSGILVLLLALVAAIFAVMCIQLRNEIGELKEAAPSTVVEYKNDPLIYLHIVDSGPFAVKLNCEATEASAQVYDRSTIPDGEFLVTEVTSKFVGTYLCKRAL